MNPDFHDEFVTLVPLFYSGELSDEEWALLQVHMAYCESCREAFEQYQHVTANVVPAMVASGAGESVGAPVESEHSLRQAEEQLIRELREKTAASVPPPSKSLWTWMGIGAIAASVAGALLYLGIRHVGPPSQGQASSSHSVVAPEPVAAAAAKSSDKPNSVHSAQDAQKISSLQNQLAQVEKTSAQSRESVAGEKQLLQNEEAQQQQLITQRDTLSGQLTEARAEAQSLRDKLAAVQSGAGQQTAQVTELEAKVQRLDTALEDANAALDAKDKLLAFDRDLMLHDRDIRDVIGARNLYIADIYDTTANGTTAKPFGRIFYTKDSSLVFYGFDLDKQAGSKQSVAFQAWGSGTDRRPVSLGLFYQDDGHQRWVLKCKDAATLARLDMVFVTIEPPGGSNKPTGKQFLRAYLQIQPNHP